VHPQAAKETRTFNSVTPNPQHRITSESGSQTRVTQSALLRYWIVAKITLQARGNLGPSMLNAFLEDGTFNITVLSRENSRTNYPSNVKVVRANYASVESLKSAFQGQDAVLSFVGFMGLDEQRTLIDAAIGAGVKRFMPSEYGSDSTNARLREIVPSFNKKKTIVDYLKSKENEISWSSVVTGPFFDWGIKVGFLGFDARRKTVTLIDEGKAPISVTNMPQVGRAVVKVLQKAEETKNQYVFVSSFQTTQKDILAGVEKATGAKWTVNYIASKDLVAQGRQKMSRGDFSGVSDLIRAGAFGGFGDNSKNGLWNEKLGLEKEDFDESIKAGLSGRLLGEQ
jgi:hypothetical protein